MRSMKIWSIPLRNIITVYPYLYRHNVFLFYLTILCLLSTYNEMLSQRINYRQKGLDFDHVVYQFPTTRLLYSLVLSLPHAVPRPSALHASRTCFTFFSSSRTVELPFGRHPEIPCERPPWPTTTMMSLAIWLHTSSSHSLLLLWSH